MTLFRIIEGVHRCVAAHRAGCSEIRARIDTGGSLGPVQWIRLDYLYSPKAVIGRWDRGRDFEVLVRIMSDPVQRDTIPPVILTALPATRAKYLKHVAGVTVSPV